MKNLIERIKAFFGFGHTEALAAPKPQPQPAPDAPSWTFATIWNQSLTRVERPARPRSNIWASEIGGSFIDRYLKMTGVPPSNAPNDRSLRKYMAGDVWEWICALVLKRAGILIEAQKKVAYQYPGLLAVMGKMDFLAGGQPDWERARREVNSLTLPEMLNNASLAIIARLEETYGNDPLKIMVMEIKSCSSFMFERYDRTGANPHHEGQVFHYLKAENLDEGHLVYVCKDDCLLLECPVYNPSDTEKYYKADIEQMTGYLETQTVPEIEKEVQFDGLRFSTNWKVEYSNYLTMLYDYKTPMEYRERWDKPVSDFNRVFKRCIIDAKMTDKNVAVIAEAVKTFPEWDVYVEQARKAVSKNPKLVEVE